MAAETPVYRRILLKLSGEALMGEQKFGIAPDVVARLADEIRDVHRLGVETAVVLGGGNIIRGVSAAAQGIDRVAGDHMGLLATAINGLALQDALEKRSVTTRPFSRWRTARRRMNGSAIWRTSTADISRLETWRFSRASWSASPLITVARRPM